MLSWLLDRLFGRQAAASERGLFAYWDGQKQRQIDTVAAFRAIWTHPDCNLSSDARMAMGPRTKDGALMVPAAEIYAAEDRIRQMTRDVFGVRAWSETQPGLTTDETDALLARFWTHVQQIKKKRNTLPMQSLPSASTVGLPSADTPPLPASDSPAISSPDCGCTGAASSEGEPSEPSMPSAVL